MRTVLKQETCMSIPTEMLSVAHTTAVLGSQSDHLLPKYQLANPHFLQWVVWRQQRELNVI